MPDNTRILSLDGPMTIENVDHIKEEILSLLNETDQVILNLTRVERIDLAFVQLLYAAQREAKAIGKELHLHGILQSEVIGTLRSAGFIREHRDDAREIEAELIEFGGTPFPAYGTAQEADSRSTEKATGST